MRPLKSHFPLSQSGSLLFLSMESGTNKCGDPEKSAHGARSVRHLTPGRDRPPVMSSAESLGGSLNYPYGIVGERHGRCRKAPDGGSAGWLPTLNAQINRG